MVPKKIIKELRYTLCQPDEYPTFIVWMTLKEHRRKCNFEETLDSLFFLKALGFGYCVAVGNKLHCMSIGILENSAQVVGYFFK